MSTRVARAIAVVVGAAVVAMLIGEVPLTRITHAGFFAAVGDPLPLAFGPVGLLVALKRPNNPIGWTMVLAGLFAEVDAFASQYAVAVYRDHHALPLGRLAVLVQPSWAPAIVCFGVIVQLFPTGEFPRGRWRWPLFGFLVIGLAWVLGAFAIALNAVLRGTVVVTSGGDLVQIDHPSGVASLWGWTQSIFFPALGVLFICWFIREAPAFRRASGEHRQQLKWLMGGATLAVVGGFLAVSNTGIIGGLGTVAVAALPITVGIGVLKYRLYEIDRIVSRTLAYAIVTGTLVGVFVGLVVLTTHVLPFSSPVGVAASTLAAAALFNPLRIRVQRLVDRRFNRAHYDAEATVQAFARSLREALDLETVETGLTEAVMRAVEPAHLTVWIKGAS